MPADSTSQPPLFSLPPNQPPEPEPKAKLEAGARPQLHAAAPLKAAIAAWQEHMAHEGLSIHTVKAFGADINLLSKFSGSSKALRDVTTRELENYLRWMETGRGVPCSPKTYSRRVTSLKSFFRWLSHTGVLAADPAEPIIQKSAISPLPEFLSAEEIRAVLSAANLFRPGRHASRPDAPAKPDARPYVLVALLLQTGIKKGECLALVPNHVDLSDPGSPVLWVRYGNPKQRYKERKLALDPSWVPAFREYLGQYSPRDKLFPWSPRRLEYLLEDVGKLAGLGKHLSFDMCRWTCAVRDRRGGMDPDKIRQKLGLSKIQWREVGVKLERLVAEPL